MHCWGETRHDSLTLRSRDPKQAKRTIALMDGTSELRQAQTSLDVSALELAKIEFKRHGCLNLWQPENLSNVC